MTEIIKSCTFFHQLNLFFKFWILITHFYWSALKPSSDLEENVDSLVQPKRNDFFFFFFFFHWERVYVLNFRMNNWNYIHFMASDHSFSVKLRTLQYSLSRKKKNFLGNIKYSKKYNCLNNIQYINDSS